MATVAADATGAQAAVSASASASAPSASSQPSPPPRPPRDLRWVERTILCVLVCAWIIYFALLADRPLVAQGIYQDENSLSSYHHRSDLRAEPILPTLERELRRAHAQGGADELRAWIRAQMRKSELEVHEFVHDHSASPLVPLRLGDGVPAQLSASHDAVAAPTVITYGIWRAPKSDGKECVLLVTEYDPADLTAAVPATGSSSAADSDPAYSGLSILLTVMQDIAFNKGREYFGRDVIVLAVEKQSAGSPSRHWAKQRAVAAFGGWMAAYKSASPALHRSGNIFTTMVLDIPLQGAGAQYESLSLDVVGFYGLAPNLDLPSLLLRVADAVALQIVVAESVLHDEDEPRRGDIDGVAKAQQSAEQSLAAPLSLFLARHAPFLHRSFYSVHTPNEQAATLSVDPYGVLSGLFGALGQRSPFDPRGGWPSGLARFKGLWRYMIQALQGGSMQYHAHANKFAIDAATLRAVQSRPGSPAMSAQQKLAVAQKIAQHLDWSLRSVNNLAEKLHHSTWWYLLNNRSDFTTMSKHIYVIVLPMAALAILALGLMSSSLVPGASPPVHTVVQRFAHSACLVAAVYALLASQFWGVDAAIATVGGGRWNQQAMHAWCAFVAASWAAFFLLLFPRTSQLGSAPRAAHDPSAPVVALHPRHLAVAECEAAAAADAARVAAGKPALPPAAPLGLELPLSPPGLPLLVPAQLSPSTPAPVYCSSMDWRTTQALLLLCVVACLAPTMVLNTPACALTLAFVVPLALGSRADQWPGRWMPALRALRDRQGRPLPLGLAGNATFQTLKYALRALLHLSVLLLCSPPVLLLLFAQFHGLSLSAAAYSLLDSLAHSPSNILSFTFFFAYAPSFVCSLMLLLCSFRLHANTRTGTSGVEMQPVDAAVKKVQ